MTRRAAGIALTLVLATAGHVPEAADEAVLVDADLAILAATDDALAQPMPTPESVPFGVYSPDVDPTSERFDTEDDPQFEGGPTTMVDLLNACMRDEMARDERILVFGEDVADVSREQHLGKVKGKVTIEFADLEDLERIYHTMTTPGEKI